MTLESLLARQEITELLYRYARGCDRADEAALRGCFWPDAQRVEGARSLPAQDFCTHVLRVVRALQFSAHVISNVLIALEGAAAVAECHFTAHHRGQDLSNRFIKGRYIDRLERRDNIWRIARRVQVYEIDMPLPSGGVADSANRPGLAPDDPLYAMLAELRPAELRPAGLPAGDA